MTATTISTVEQVYHCLFKHYYGGEKLDSRRLLTAAFAGLARELHRRGRDLPEAAMPALSGQRQSDWAAFSAVHTRVIDQMAGDDLRQHLAAATINGMVDSLGDNHARWVRPEGGVDRRPGTEFGLGFDTSPFAGVVTGAPQQTTPPLHVTVVRGGPAADKGLRPGDIIRSVNGAPPFVGGILSVGAVRPLFQSRPGDQVELRLHRPATGRTWTVTMKPAGYRPNPKTTPMVTAKALKGGVAYARVAAFGPRVADTARKAISDLGKGKKQRGVVLDLRGNTGGIPGEVNRLLGAFAHGKITAYHCDADERCAADRTDDSVALLNLPLVVLVDRDCASACDHFVSAVKHHKLGPVVGTRTAGVVSGAGRPLLLDDNSILSLPDRHHRGPDRAVVNGIGVAPDHYVPLTAKDLSTGKDPGLAKALSLLP